MSETIYLPLPPMPDVDDFRDDEDCLSHVAYGNALTAWQRVCDKVIAANERIAASAAFWSPARV